MFLLVALPFCHRGLEGEVGARIYVINKFIKRASSGEIKANAREKCEQECGVLAGLPDVLSGELAVVDH
jgi:hypothetical protein